MKKLKKFLFAAFTVAILSCLLCQPAFAAISESDVQAQVDAVGKEAVSGNVFIWFLCAIRLLESVCDQWELTGFHRATYEYHAEKLRKIADKLQAGIGYDYDKAVERCKKKRARKSHSNDVGEDALLLTVRAAGKSADNEKEAAPYEEDTPWEPELE